VLPASGGAEAVKIFLCNRIDLVVLDYDMPEMKGHVLATELKSLNPKIPVIMQSGSPDLPEAVTGTADAFLPKDQSLAPLLLAISTLIKSKGAAANSLSA
jgi:CheY-like chemotaxis protein